MTDIKDMNKSIPTKVTGENKCHHCKKKNHRGWTCSLAPNGVFFCGEQCITRYVRKKLINEVSTKSLMDLT